MKRLRKSNTKGAFSLIELLVVIAIIGVLVGVLLPALSRARDFGRQVACLSNQRQIGVAIRMYLDDHRGEFFHHHEGWVLDDGSQVNSLPMSLAEVGGGGVGHSEAEKPWVIFIQPYLQSRDAGFCAADPTPRSSAVATTLTEYNGAITDVNQTLPPGSELAIAERDHLTTQSFLLNSILSHKSARYALEGALDGFLNDSRGAGLQPASLAILAERNSEAMNAVDNNAFGSVGQDDFDAWVGEAPLVRWGSEAIGYEDEGWIRYNRHSPASNFVYLDGHAETRSWSAARSELFPDRRVRQPLLNPPL